MQHSIEWLDQAVNAAPEERATAADLRLFIGNQNVTTSLLDGAINDHVTVALYGLASGLIHDWWSIFGARDREVSLARYRTGYLIPDIRIRFDGDSFDISTHQMMYRDPDVRFWGGATEVLSRDDMTAWLSSFVQEVLARLDAMGIHETSAHLRWRRIQASLQASDRIFCEAAGSMGLDPYQISDSAAEFIERAENIFAGEALVEFIAGAGNADRSGLAGWTERMMRERGSSYRLANLRSLVDKIAGQVPSRAGEAAWSVGYRRARSMRQELGLQSPSRFTSFRDLAKRLGASSSYNLAPRIDGINALRRESHHGIDIHLRNHGDAAGARGTHLFVLARAIGDAACFPAQEASPINDVHYAYRQAAGRAFAAEFLAPIDEIMSMQADARDRHSIANEFGVSPMVIQHQVENRERIGQACG